MTPRERKDVNRLFPGHNYKYTIIVRTEVYSNRYNKSVILPLNFMSDGATKAIDLCPVAFFAHDKLCVEGVWSDGSPCTNRQASTFYSDLLRENGHLLASLYRWPATWLFGGGKCRDNGMW